MSNNFYARLISRSLLSELCNRFGGLTSDAWNAVNPEAGPLPDGAVRLLVRPNPDKRVGRVSLEVLHQALRSIDTICFCDKSEIIVRLISFYLPLFPSNGATIDDSGGRIGAVGPVLSPEKCRYLLDWWRSINKADAAKILNGLPVFHFMVTDAQDLLGYLGCYAGFLEEAVARDSYYFSVDGDLL